MEIITMESEAYQNLVASIKRIEQHMLNTSAKNTTPDDEVWIGTKDASLWNWGRDTHVSANS